MQKIGVGPVAGLSESRVSGQDLPGGNDRLGGTRIRRRHDGEEFQRRCGPDP